MNQTARPISDISNTGWTPSPVYLQIGGTVPNDASPVSANVSPGGTFVVQLSSLAAPMAGQQTLTVRLRITDETDLTVVFALLQAGSPIASMTVSPTTTFMNFDLLLTENEIDQITDYSNLQLSVSTSAGSASGSQNGSGCQTSMSGSASGSFSGSYVYSMSGSGSTSGNND